MDLDKRLEEIEAGRNAGEPIRQQDASLLLTELRKHMRVTEAAKRLRAEGTPSSHTRSQAVALQKLRDELDTLATINPQGEADE